VAACGFKTREDIRSLEDLGYKGFLVGEALMRGDDPAAGLAELIGAA
jgi:indole-3-glycerol phosphate synthase